MQSWLEAVPGRTSRDTDFLLDYFSTYTRNEGMLPWYNIDPVLTDIIVRMDYEIIGGPNFTTDYIIDALLWSHLYLIAKAEENIGHARIVFGLVNDGVLVVDPMMGYVHWSFPKIKTFDTLLVGWATGRYSGAMSPRFT